MTKTLERVSKYFYYSVRRGIILKRVLIYTLFIIALLSPVMVINTASHAQEKDKYISETRVFCGESEEEVIERLRMSGYEPVMTNIAKERPDFKSSFVYIGYKTTTDPDESVEGRASADSGSVFGDSSLMIAGVALIIGVAVGMISMKIRPATSANNER